VVRFSISGTRLSVGSRNQTVNKIVYLFGSTARSNKYPKSSKMVCCSDVL
jgi:hypothetical protein